MEPDPAECMFCHDGLPSSDDQPDNLTFLTHIEGNEACRSAFDNWTTNMQTDWLGD